MLDSAWKVSGNWNWNWNDRGSIIFFAILLIAICPFLLFFFFQTLFNLAFLVQSLKKNVGSRDLEFAFRYQIEYL